MNQIYMDDHITLGHNLLSITDVPSLEFNHGRRQKEIYWCIMEKYLIIKSFVRNLKISSLKQNVILNFCAWGLDEFGIEFINQIDSQHAFAFWLPKKKYFFKQRSCWNKTIILF